MKSINHHNDHRRASRRISAGIRYVSRARTRSVAREDGQATVEFAVVAVVFLFIVVGVLFFGRLINYSIDATHLANEAARYAAVDQNPGPGSTLTNTILGQIDSSELKNGSTDVSNKANLTFCFPNGTSQVGSDPVQAKVQFTFHFIPLLGLADVHVTQTATMLLEQPQNTSVYATQAC